VLRPSRGGLFGHALRCRQQGIIFTTVLPAWGSKIDAGLFAVAAIHPRRKAARHSGEQQIKL